MSRVELFSRWFAVALLAALLASCGSAPPAPPKQILEYERHTSVGLEKNGHGYLVESRNAFRRALVFAELDDQHERITSALLNLGASELLLDDPEAAGRAYARAVREARLGNLPVLEWQARCGLAEASRRLGQPEKALELYAGLPAGVQPGVVTQQLPMEINRALALSDMARHDEALAVLVQAEALARRDSPKPEAKASLAALLLARARISLVKGDLSAAEVDALAALAIDHELHYPPSVADDHRWLGKILRARNVLPKALDHYQRAARIYLQTGQSKRLAEVQALIVEVTPMTSDLVK